MQDPGLEGASTSNICGVCYLFYIVKYVYVLSVHISCVFSVHILSNCFYYYRATQYCAIVLSLRLYACVFSFH